MKYKANFNENLSLEQMKKTTEPSFSFDGYNESKIKA